MLLGPSLNGHNVFFIFQILFDLIRGKTSLKPLKSSAICEDRAPLCCRIFSVAPHAVRVQSQSKCKAASQLVSLHFLIMRAEFN